MTKDKNKRKAMWTSQCGKCAICLEHQETVIGMCFVQGKMICRKCSTSLSNYRSALARGVTPEILAVFLAREPAVESEEPEETLPTVTPTEEPPDRLMVNGVWCRVIDGAWIPVESE